jgi:hypothetical protein
MPSSPRGSGGRGRGRVAFAKRSVAAESLLSTGAYLTDGARLFRVIDALGDSVVLEDCGEPEKPAAVLSVAELPSFSLVRRD